MKKVCEKHFTKIILMHTIILIQSSLREVYNGAFA